MSCRYPAVVTFSLNEFAQHGGNVGDHRDGWGIAFVDGPDARVIREPSAAATSALVQCVKEHCFATTCVMAHIRKATVGEVSLRNTQPFQRELGGQVHLFAHNGHVPDVVKLPLGRYRPIGDTDSEYSFCVLVERLRSAWETAVGIPELSTRKAIITEMAFVLRSMGPANFLYSDGDALFVHADRRTQTDGTLRAPGLYWLRRTCPSPALAGVSVQSDFDQHVILVASVPLTDEDWIPIPEGCLMVFAKGEIHH